MVTFVMVVSDGISYMILVRIPSITKVTITEDCVKNGAQPVIERDSEKVARRAKLKTGKTEENSAVPAS